MGLITDNQVPPAVRGAQFALDVIIAGQLVQSTYRKIGFEESVACSCCFQFVIGKNIERQAKSLM